MRGLGERAQSATIGVALILALTILAATAVVALGGPALTDTRDQAGLARAEQAMTLFDSQAAQVALGDSSVQTVDMGQGEGTFSVNDTAGSISIVQLDCDDDGTNDDGNNDGSDGDDAYILPPTDLGKVVYENGDATIAYQGGGVWRQTDGGAMMVSPPEFHYRGATLTLPVVLTRGSGAASGRVSATVTQTRNAVPVYPNSSATFPNRGGDNCEETGSTETFLNPVQDGSVIVRIESDYARAWGQYFEDRTQGIVTYPSAGVVTVELISAEQVGEFEMPGEGGSITISGASGAHGTEEFTFRLRPDDTDSANFNNLQWTFYADTGNYEFEIHLKKSGSGGCSGGTTGITADANIYFSTNGGTDYQGWHADDAFEAECADLNGDGNDEIYMDIELVDDEDGDTDYTEIESDDPALEYQSLAAQDLEHFNPNGNFQTSTTFSGHGDWESETYGSGDNETIDRLVNHYFAELPAEFELTVDDKGSDTINEAGSSGTLYTGAGGRYVTYLHVTENELEIRLEG